MFQNISYQDYLPHIVQNLKSGVLLTAQADGKINPMTIGWGTIGIQWNKPVFHVFVRQSRFTKQLLDKNPFFTINIPMDNRQQKILAFCGTKSGRDFDKVKACQLTAVDLPQVNVPGFKELPLTLVCKIIYQQDQQPQNYPADIKQRFYVQPQIDYHTTYIGEIVATYLIEADHD